MSPKHEEIINIIGDGKPRVKPFQGEMMHCFNCGKDEKSDPNVESGWTIFEIDDKVVYVCTACFPSPKLSAWAYQMAIDLLFVKAVAWSAAH